MSLDIVKLAPPFFVKIENSILDPEKTAKSDGQSHFVKLFVKLAPQPVSDKRRH